MLLPSPRSPISLTRPAPSLQPMQVILSTRSIVILVLQAITSGGLAGFFHDQTVKGVYDSLTPTIYNDANQIAAKNTTISQLQNTIANQNSQILQLQSPSVDGWFRFSGSQCYYSCSVDGAISNYGTQDAKNVIVTLNWKNNGAFVQSNTISFGNIAGRTLVLYPATQANQYFELNAPANQLSWSFSWAT